MNSTFLDACNKKEPAHTPVWFMRQAGRYLPSYRAVKGNRPVTEIAKDPALASQVVVDAVRALDVDAGIIFADIMLPLEGMGVQFKIEENVGPIVTNPIRTLDDVNSLETLSPEEDVGYIFDGIEATLQKLDDTVPLIGFSGAPFTLAGYMIEGRPSRDLEKTKQMMYREPETWHRLMSALTKMINHVPRVPSVARRRRRAALRQLGGVPLALRLRELRLRIHQGDHALARRRRSRGYTSAPTPPPSSSSSSTPARTC